MPRKKAASFTCNQCGKEFAMAMHLGRHMTTIHGQASKSTQRKKAGKIGGRKGGRGLCLYRINRKKQGSGA